MISEIITAISLQLNKMYPDVTVEVDHIKQGLKEPCFFIEVLEPVRTPLVGQKWQQDNMFDVQLFSSTENNIQLYTVAEELFEGLEYITLRNGSLLRGTSMRFEVVDGVLHFLVKYTVFLQREEQQTYMEVLDMKEGLKE